MGGRSFCNYGDNLLDEAPTFSRPIDVMISAWNSYQHLANENNFYVVHELSSQSSWIIFVWHRIQGRCDFGTKQERDKIWTTLKHARGWLIKLVFIYKYIIFNHLQIYIFLISPKLILSRTSSSSLYKTWKVAPCYHPMEAFLDCLKPRRDILTIKCWKHRKS